MTTHGTPHELTRARTSWRDGHGTLTPDWPRPSSPDATGSSAARHMGTSLTMDGTSTPRIEPPFWSRSGTRSDRSETGGGQAQPRTQTTVPMGHEYNRRHKQHHPRQLQTSRFNQQRNQHGSRHTPRSHLQAMPNNKHDTFYNDARNATRHQTTDNHSTYSCCKR